MNRSATDRMEGQSARTRVLFVSPCYPPPWGGIQTVAEFLPSATARLASVGLITIGQTNRSPTFPATFIRPGRTAALRLASAVVRTAVRIKPEVVHALTWRVAVPTLLIPRRRLPRLVIHIHGAEIHRVGRVSKRVRDMLFRRAELLLAVSTFTAGQVSETFHHKVRVFPNAVAESETASTRRVARAGTLAVLSVGRLVARKGHVRVIEACAAARAAGEDIRLTIVGEGPERPRVALAAGSQDWVELRGAVDRPELEALYETADAFCLLPLGMNGDIEGFGIAFLEAAAHGLPAVASDEGGVQEAVLSGQTGLVVTSVDGAARALIALSRDPALRSRLGEAGRKYARTMTWSARAEMLLSLLQQPS